VSRGYKLFDDWLYYKNAEAPADGYILQSWSQSCNRYCSDFRKLWKIYQTTAIMLKNARLLHTIIIQYSVDYHGRREMRSDFREKLIIRHALVNVTRCCSVHNIISKRHGKPLYAFASRDTQLSLDPMSETSNA